MKNLLKRKLFHIPLALLAVVLTLGLLGGGMAIGQWAFNQNNTGSISVTGSGLALFTNQADTTPLVGNATLPAFASPLNMDMATPISGNTPSIWVLNTGKTNLTPTISASITNPNMVLHSTTLGALGSTPVALITQIWALNGVTMNLYPSITVTTPITTVGYDGGSVIGTPAPSGYFIIDSEKFSYTSWNSSTSSFDGVTRAVLGTTAATHTAGGGKQITCATMSGSLAPGQQAPLSFFMSAAEGSITDLNATANYTITVASVAGQ